MRIDMEWKVEDLKEFFGIEDITYKDNGKGETYTIIKGHKRLILGIYGTSIDGGWLSTKVEEVE